VGGAVRVPGLKTNAFLLTQIRFKPPIIAQLAQEAGSEPSELDRLKRLGPASAAELRALLGTKEPPPSSAPEDGRGSSGGGDVPNAMQPDAAGPREASPAGGTAAGVPGSSTGTSSPSHDSPDASHGSAGGSTSQPVKMPGPSVTGSPRPIHRRHSLNEQGQTGQHKPDAEPLAKPGVACSSRLSRSSPMNRLLIRAVDPNGLAHAARMALEEAAIVFIPKQEPDWQRRSQRAWPRLHGRSAGGAAGVGVPIGQSGTFPFGQSRLFRAHGCR
jgi:hypothetical protein